MSALIRRIAGVAAVAALAVGLSACTGGDKTTQAYLDQQGSGYIAGDGQIINIDKDKRGEPVVFEGTDQDGNPLGSKDVAGDVVVVNFWYASCAPCRVETEYLESVYEQTKDQGVSFIGINVLDAPDTAKSFMDEFGVTYPSVIDAGDGAAKIAFAQEVPLGSTPNTVILDREGRVGARIVGPVVGDSVLRTLVTELGDES